MLDVNLIRNNPDQVKNGISKKGANPKLVDDFLALDRKWRENTQQVDELRARQNKLSEERNIEEGKKVKIQVQDLEVALRQLEVSRSKILEQIPNLPAPDIPVGDESANTILREVGKKPKFEFEPKDYLTLAGSFIDTERAAKISGSRFNYLLGDLALLQFAILKLIFDKLLPKGFMPIIPPVLVKPEVMKGMGKIKFIEDEDAYLIQKDDLYLIGSAEHSIGPFHADEILEIKSLPRRYVGFSTSFRREAGSYGKDTRGILRVHQFDKAEMFIFAEPSKSEEEHQLLLSCQEELMQSLSLPYQVVQIATGDMTFADYKQYDIETWIPSEGRYRETHSCSNTTDFQARGINAKYRTSNGGTDFLHTLNATAFAMGRILIAILENYQTKKGRVVVPKVLRDYVGRSEIASPKEA